MPSKISAAMVSENVNKFENRLEQMQKLESGNYDNEILSLLCDISL